MEPNVKTIAQIIHHNTFPLFLLDDSDVYVLYYEDSMGFWVKRLFDKDGNQSYCETSDGTTYTNPYENYCKHNP